MELALLIPLSVMIVSDFRRREVSLWALLLFGCLQAGMAVWEYGLIAAGKNMLANMLVCLAAGLFCLAWFGLRGKPPKDMIGSGDLLFILFITPAFTLAVFPVFMLVSFSVTLTAWAVCYWAGRAPRNIPLISGTGICYACMLVYLFYRSV